jgi:hypothetical protein
MKKIFDGSGSRDGSVGIATRLRTRQDRSWGSIPGRAKRFFTSPYTSHWISDPPSLLSDGLRDYGGRFLKLNSHFHLVSSSKIVELYLHSSIRLHGVALN